MYGGHSQFDGNAAFSGGGFMSSQATQTADASFSSSKKPDTQPLVPLPIKQINEALQANDENMNFLTDGVDVNNVKLVGLMHNKAERVTDGSFTPDDGTGRIDGFRWVNEDIDSKEMGEVSDGMDVRVHGHLKGFQGKKKLMVSERPPLLTGTNYVYWRKRMEIYMMQVDFDIWTITESGPFVPSEIFVDADGTSHSIPKPPSKYTKEDKTQLSLNAKALHILICGLNETEYSRVSNCVSAYEVWNLLELSYQGTTQVKETKIGIYATEYELFRMKPGESLNAMHQRFSTIVNNMASLGQPYPVKEQCRKILFALPKKFKAKVTAIRESKDLSTLTVHELICNLEIEELVLSQEKMRDDIEKSAKKSFAFHASSHKTKIEHKAKIEDIEDEVSEGSSDDEIGCLARDLRKLHHKYGKFIKKTPNKFIKRHGKEIQHEDVKCYKCDKFGHIKANCPLRKPKIKTIMQATWSDDESNDEDDDNNRMINACAFMVNDNDEKLHELAPSSAQNPSSGVNTPMRGYQVPTANHFSGQYSTDGLKAIDKMVLDYLQQPASLTREKGVHRNELVQQLNVPLEKIQEAIEALELEGMVYSTIDECHYKSTANG